MYTEHFGLEKGVFDGGIAQNDDLFLGPRQQRIAANLKIGLTTRDSVVALTGPLGVGKTTIAAQALRITATRLAQTWIGSTPLAPDELLELLLAGFELAPHDMGRVQRIHAWRQFMGEMSVTDTRICILVENAAALGITGLQALEALTSADPNDCPGANLVLMGPRSLPELLDDPALASLRQRIRSRQRLEPMSAEEVEQYLRHRVSVAGGDYDKMFAPGTAAMVHCFSAGVPRVINNVCETALIVVATRKLEQLTPAIVQRVAEGVYGLAPSGELPEIPVAAAPAAESAPAAVEESPAEEAAPEAAPVIAEEKPSAPEAAPSTAAQPTAQKPVPPAEPAPVASEEQPAKAPVAPTEPAPVVAAAPAPEAAPVIAAEKPPAPAAAPSTAAQPPAQKPVPSAEPAPVAAAAPAPKAAPVVAEVPTAAEPVMQTEPAPAVAPTPEAAPAAEPAAPAEPAAAAEANAEADDDEVDAELLEALLAAEDGDIVEHPAEPPVLTHTSAANTQAQDIPIISSTPDALVSPSDLPVLTDEVDFELPIGDQNELAIVEPPEPTLPPDAPKLPAELQKADDKFTEDFAAATHLHEISDEMAEMLFSADPAATASLDTREIVAAVERTAVVEQLNGDDASDEDDDNHGPQAVPTVVF